MATSDSGGWVGAEGRYGVSAGATGLDEPPARLDGDAIAHLVRRQGRMAEIGADDGVVRLDWVDGVARLLADPSALEAVESQAADLWHRGVRHVVWSGMGGSVNTVHVLIDLGLCQPTANGIAVHPLDSTDPAAVNALISTLASAKGLTLPADDGLRALLADTHLIAVSLGVTSEEPISHLVWYVDLLRLAGLPPDQHVTVLTVDGSHLGAYAREHDLPVRSVYVGETTGLPGRMSAPTSLVFLLPVALDRAGEPGSGRLREVLTRAWRAHDLGAAERNPMAHPYVRMAMALLQASRHGRCRVRLPATGSAMLTWIEQLLEQSLGKGGQGVVVFDDQDVAVELTLDPPATPAADPVDRVASLAVSFLGWQLCTAIYGYQHSICIVDEPAVERYKALARQWRDLKDPLAQLATSGWSERVIQRSEVPVLAAHLAELPCSYLDLTVNGELATQVQTQLAVRARRIGNELLQVPVKVRTAPAAYHISEQSELDGPPDLVSIRFVGRRYTSARIGPYSSGFLQAQAMAAWQAMNERGRACYLVVLDDMSSDGPGGLIDFVDGLAQALEVR